MGHKPEKRSVSPPKIANQNRKALETGHFPVITARQKETGVPVPGNWAPTGRSINVRRGRPS